MNIEKLHEWPLSPGQAVDIQNQLRSKIKLEPLPAAPKFIAGADVSYTRNSDDGFAAVVVLTWPQLEMVELQVARDRVPFPYIPGLLSFREAPILLQAFEKLHTRPDVILFDGQGIAHPRTMGLATHMGLWLQLPSIGCAKSKLFGTGAMPDSVRGSWKSLHHDGREIGAIVRTRTGVKPVFVSPGHLITLRESIDLVLHAATRYRLPEPLRQAHLQVNSYRMRVEK